MAITSSLSCLPAIANRLSEALSACRRKFDLYLLAKHLLIMSGKQKNIKGFKKDWNNTDLCDIQDDRFVLQLSAPIFKKSSNQRNKVVLDDRFKSVLTDERFRSAPGGTVDKYGRKKKKSIENAFAAKELKEFYTVENTEEAVDDSSSTKTFGKVVAKQDAEERLDYLTKLARGEVDALDGSDSDSDSGDMEDIASSSDSSGGEEDMDVMEDDSVIKQSVLDIPDSAAVEYGEEATKRLAVLNCDWEHLKATDIMMVLQSFCPAGKSVKKVTVYPSDFGLERMAAESRFGPQGIWKKTEEQEDDEEVRSDGSDMGEESEGGEEDSADGDQEDDAAADSDREDVDSNNSEDQEEDGDDIYGNIEYFGADDVEDEDSNSKASPTHRAGRGQDGDLVRKEGAVGLVFHDDAKRHIEYQSKQKNKKKSSDLDEIALREYELSKLKYYFAIVDCDSIETANGLYEELDGLELENSAMTFDIRFVPNEENFAPRQVRDSCLSLPAKYSPPAFIVQALQHTKVQCSWDEGEKDREHKLTNISQWRQLNESDFMQYMASDNSSDDDDQEEDSELDREVDDNSKGDSVASDAKAKKKGKKTAKAQALRKLLLGDAANASESELGSDAERADDIDTDVGGREDFFMEGDEDDNSFDDGSELQVVKTKSSKKSKGVERKDKHPANDEEDNEEMVLTYNPDAESELALKAKTQGMTPFEADELKLKEKKKAKKAARKAAVDSLLEEQERQRQQRLEEAKKLQQQAQLQKLNNPDEEEDEEGKLVMKDKKSRKLMIKSKNKKKLLRQQQQQLDEGDADGIEEEGLGRSIKKSEGDDGFKVNVADDRFAALFEGDARFGIDTTASEFKSTSGVQQILQEQRKRRQKKKKQHHGGDDGGSTDKQPVRPGVSEGAAGKDVDQLVNRLKRKFQG
jgi:hypothetical protein